MNDPKKVWIFLTQRFEASSIAHQSAIQLQFQSLHLRSGQTIDSYITEANNLFFRLSSVGINLFYLQLINQVLDGLPRSYNELVATICTSLTLTQQISLTLVHQTLAAEELRQATERPNNPHNAHTALYMNVTKSQSSTSGNGPYRNQAARGKSGNRQQVQHHSTRSHRPSCRYCHWSNHSLDKCWQQFPEKRPRRHIFSNAMKAESRSPLGHHSARILAIDYSECALSSLAVDVPATIESSPLWYLDSACTNHITRFGDSLQDYCLLPVPQRIRVGNGEFVNAIGIGTAVLQLLLLVGVIQLL